MSLAEAFERVAPSTPSHQVCSVTKARNSLSAGEREFLDGLLSNPDVQGTAIAAALREEGHAVGNDAVQRHRRRACSCSRLEGA